MRPEDQKQEHTASYYAATIAHPTDYPEVQGQVEADICVVGAGFTGTATALTLAERGYKVVLVEANRVGWGATGRNGGQLIRGMNGMARLEKKHGKGIAGAVDRLTWRGNEIVLDRIDRYGIDCDFKPGWVETAVKPRQVAELEEMAEEFEAENNPWPWALWDRDTTREKLGSDAYLGGFICYRDGHLHPLNLCIGEARAAEQLGARIFEQSPVTDILHGDRPTVVTPRGQVTADAVVLAGNAYGRFKQPGMTNLVFPAGGYMIATEPLPENVVAEINPDDVAVCDLNNIVDYHRLSADRRMLYGGACNYSGKEPESIESFIRPRMLARYPQLAPFRIDYQWGGKMGIVVNRVPALGRVHGNVYFCQGFSGHGVSGTHVMGEVMADAVTGTLETFDLFAQVKHLRIPGSQWVGNQIIALGMLYYRMRDMM